MVRATPVLAHSPAVSQLVAQAARQSCRRCRRCHRCPPPLLPAAELLLASPCPLQDPVLLTFHNPALEAGWRAYLAESLRATDVLGCSAQLVSQATAAFPPVGLIPALGAYDSHTQTLPASPCLRSWRLARRCCTRPALAPSAGRQRQP